MTNSRASPFDLAKGRQGFPFCDFKARQLSAVMVLSRAAGVDGVEKEPGMRANAPPA